jgi:hypothetical protein
MTVIMGGGIIDSRLFISKREILLETLMLTAYSAHVKLDGER